MPRFTELPERAIPAIAKQIGPKLAFMMLTSGTVDAAVHESMEVWMLGADSVTERREGLPHLARWTGRWHHQIKSQSGNVPIAYARSKPRTDTDTWKVVSVSDSARMSGMVDEAIHWIDKQADLTDDIIVRLLEVPAFHIWTFWLVAPDLEESGRGRIVVISAPKGSPLEALQFYTDRQFLDILRTMPPIRGLVFNQ